MDMRGLNYMHNNRLVRKGLVLGIIGILVLVMVAPSVSSNQLFEDDTVLTRQHIPYLLLNLIITKDMEIKQILREVINKITIDKLATEQDVQNIVKSIIGDNGETYILARIESHTWGVISCFPGQIRAEYGILLFITALYSPHLYGFISKGSIVDYTPEAYGYGDWNFKIRGEPVSREAGKIIGFFGLAGYSYIPHPKPPYESFDLKGIGLIVIHGE